MKRYEYEAVVDVKQDNLDANLKAYGLKGFRLHKMNVYNTSENAYYTLVFERPLINETEKENENDIPGW